MNCPKCDSNNIRKNKPILNAPNHSEALALLERTCKNHPDATIRNLERLQTVYNPHADAICKAITALLNSFGNNKIYIIIEAEISSLGKRSRPEDFIAWIENIGIFVIEVKSHRIDGIKSFENNIPQVIYKGDVNSDTNLLDQPRDFCYKLRSELEPVFDNHNKELPPLYFAGWLPNVSPEDVASKSATVAPEKIWLSDMLDKTTFQNRLGTLQNITKGTRTERDSLELFCSIFGTTSGLRKDYTPRVAPIGSIGQAIDRKNNQLRHLTIEQEKLAFSPNLVRGPKVIRGVAGSGKTIVLANAVSEVFIRAKSAQEGSLNLSGTDNIPRVLVLCYNRALVNYLKDLIKQCFESRKPKTNWTFPNSSLTVENIDRYAYHLASRGEYDVENVGTTVNNILKRGNIEPRFKSIFIDEGQDIDLNWYPLIRQLAIEEEEGKNIIVFYDDAQNLYGVKRPDTSGSPWKDLLGSVPNNRGLSTIMRVGHRNTNQILSFSFNFLLGAFAETDPQMAEFANLRQYEKDTIPDDPAINHPRAGLPCVEYIDKRQVKVNFAVHDFCPPNVHQFNNENDMLSALLKNIQQALDIYQDNVEPSDILIMVPWKKNVIAINRLLNNAGIQTHSPLIIGNNDGRDQPVFQKGKITVSTIKSVKGYTSHVCHLVYLHEFEKENNTKQEIQQMRAQIHVACTRSSLYLDIWGTHSSLINEARLIRETIAL